MTTNYITGGSLSVDAPTYVEREADTILYEYLLNGDYCSVLTARQMGKTSLAFKTIKRLNEQGNKCAYIDITRFGVDNISAEEWYYSLANVIAEIFSIEENLYNWWQKNQRFTINEQFFKYIEYVAEEKLGKKEKLFIFIDEIDALLDVKTFSTDDFFAAIRSLFNARPANPLFNKVAFAFFGVASPDDLIRDNNRTPFNIGKIVDLGNFKLEEAKKVLMGGLGQLNANKDELFKVIFEWTNGQPYLTQVLSDQVVRKKEIKNIRQDVKYIVESEEFRNEIATHLTNIESKRIIENERYNTFMISEYEQVLRKISSRSKVAAQGKNKAHMYLKLSGLVIEENGNLVVNNKVYTKFFDIDWVETIKSSINRPFQEALDRWKKSGKQKRDTALRGDALTEYKRQLENRNDIKEEEYEFLYFSIQSEEADRAFKENASFLERKNIELETNKQELETSKNELEIKNEQIEKQQEVLLENKKELEKSNKKIRRINVGLLGLAVAFLLATTIASVFAWWYQQEAEKVAASNKQMRKIEAESISRAQAEAQTAKFSTTRDSLQNIILALSTEGAQPNEETLNQLNQLTAQKDSLEKELEKINLNGNNNISESAQQFLSQIKDLQNKLSDEKEATRVLRDQNKKLQTTITGLQLAENRKILIAIVPCDGTKADKLIDYLFDLENVSVIANPVVESSLEELIISNTDYCNLTNKKSINDQLKDKLNVDIVFSI